MIHRYCKVIGIFLIFLCSCARVIVYEDSMPSYKSQIMYCSRIHAKISFLKYNRIYDKKDFVDIPIGLDFEKKYIFRGKKPNINLELKINNPNRDRIQVYFCTKDRFLEIYSGNLPYKEFTINLPWKGGEWKEAWIEFRKSGKLVCMSSRVIYKNVK